MTAADGPPPLVSFVVPCYNYGRYLADCLNSIFSQEGRHRFEIVVVDDGSTDNTQEVLSNFSDPRIRVTTHRANQGHVAAINEGLAQARGDFVARIDPDDRYKNCYLTEVLDKLLRYPDVGLVYGNVDLIDEKGEITHRRADVVHHGRDFRGNEFLALLKKNFIPAPTVIARREVWKDALPIPQGLGFSDWYLSLRMAQRHNLYYIDRPLADYRVHAGNLHLKMVADGSGEKTIGRLLNEIFSQWGVEPRIQRAKSSIWGAQYLALADQYFHLRMDADARRCYLRAIQHRPGHLFKGGVLRRLAGTWMGRRRYEQLKHVVRLVRRLEAKG